MYVRLMVDMDVEMVWMLHYWLKAEEEEKYHSENKLTWQRRIMNINSKRIMNASPYTTKRVCLMFTLLAKT